MTIILIAGCLEILWYAWSHMRRHQLLRHLRTEEARAGCVHYHRPLCLVLLVYATVCAWSAWARHSTGASVISADLGPGVTGRVRGNVWVWTCSSDQQQSRHTQSLLAKKLVVVFPGTGFGAVPYARFCHALSKHLGATVMCLEDPRQFCVHHLYIPSHEPCMFPHHWLRLYERALSLGGVACSEHVDVFSHSNGSLRAAFVCKEARIPPAHALFYEPTALRVDWLQSRVPPPPHAGRLRMFLFNLILGDEAVVKTAISMQSPHAYSGASYVDPRTLLVSPLRQGVHYVVDTADADYVMNTAEVDARLDAYADAHPDEDRGLLTRLRHAGDHGEFVDASYPPQTLRAILQGWLQPPMDLAPTANHTGCDFADIGVVNEVLFGALYRRQYYVDFDSTFEHICKKLRVDACSDPSLRKYAMALGRYPYWMDRMTGQDIMDSRRPNDEEEDLVERVDAPALFSARLKRRRQRLPRFQL